MLNPRGTVRGLSSATQHRRRNALTRPDGGNDSRYPSLSQVAGALVDAPRPPYTLYALPGAASGATLRGQITVVPAPDQPIDAEPLG